MAVQTTFNEGPSAAFAGLKGDLSPDYCRSYINDEADIPFGILMQKVSGSDTKAELFDSGSVPLGVSVHTHAWENADLSGSNGVADGDMVSLMRKGTVWVSVEDAVTAMQPAYARHTSDGASNTQKGKFRSNYDGTAQVHTFTPTAVNDTTYSVHVYVDGKFFSYRVLADGSTDATEICDAFRTAMAADSAFTAYITASGTSTLILTAATAGLPFYAYDGGSAGVMAGAATTPNATKANKIDGCRYLTSTSGAGLALLEVNLG